MLTCMDRTSYSRNTTTPKTTLHIATSSYTNAVNLSMTLQNVSIKKLANPNYYLGLVGGRGTTTSYSGGTYRTIGTTFSCGGTTSYNGVDEFEFDEKQQ